MELESTSLLFFSSSTSLAFATSSPATADPIPARLPRDAAATRIQSAFRSHLTRALVRRISAALAAADRLEALIRKQDTVDAVRRDPRERVRVGEALLSALLELDGVPGLYAGVRDLRKRAARRLVGLQEVLDAVAEERVEEGLRGLPSSWKELVFGIEEEEGAAMAAEETTERSRGCRWLDDFASTILS